MLIPIFAGNSLDCVLSVACKAMALDFVATYKVLVLGDSNVGKTCIVHRYCDEKYYDTYISTIGRFFIIH